MSPATPRSAKRIDPSELISRLADLRSLWEVSLVDGHTNMQKPLFMQIRETIDDLSSHTLDFVFFKTTDWFLATLPSLPV